MRFLCVRPNVYFWMIPSSKSENLQFQSAVRLACGMLESLPSFAVLSSEPAELQKHWKECLIDVAPYH